MAQVQGLQCSRPCSKARDRVRSVSARAWPTLALAEPAERLRQLVTRIDYDGASGQVAIRLRPDAPAQEAGA